MRGGDQAFTAFVDARSASLLRFAYLLAPEPTAAQDLLQTALLRTYLRWGRVRDNPDAYVRRVLVTVAADERRRPHGGTLPSARMKVAAAGMHALLEGSYPTEDAIWVRDRVCKQDSFNRRGECIDLSAAEQTELERLLSTYSITWVDRFPRDLDGKPYVQVSGLEDVSPDGGWVYVSAVRGGLDCAGAPFQVRIHQNGTPFAEQGNEFLIC